MPPGQEVLSSEEASQPAEIYCRELRKKSLFLLWTLGSERVFNTDCVWWVFFLVWGIVWAEGSWPATRTYVHVPAFFFSYWEPLRFFPTVLWLAVGEATQTTLKATSIPHFSLVGKCEGIIIYIILMLNVCMCIYKICRITCTGMISFCYLWSQCSFFGELVSFPLFLFLN